MRFLCGSSGGSDTVMRYARWENEILLLEAAYLYGRCGQLIDP